MNSVSNIIEVHHLSFQYNCTNVFQNLHFELQEHKFVGLFGANGSGNTCMHRAPQPRSNSTNALSAQNMLPALHQRRTWRADMLCHGNIDFLRSGHCLNWTIARIFIFAHVRSTSECQSHRQTHLSFKSILLFYA